MIYTRVCVCDAAVSKEISCNSRSDENFISKKKSFEIDAIYFESEISKLAACALCFVVHV